MAAVPRSPETIFNWRDVCERVDGPNRHMDSLYPVVYQFTSGALRRDSGPLHGIYGPPPLVGPTDIKLAGSTVQEKVAGAPVGSVGVVGPAVAYVFTVIDDTSPGTAWIVSNGILQLAPGVQITFDPLNPVHTVEITATAPNTLFVTRSFNISVQQQITPPPPNLAPTNIQLSSLAVLEKSPGATVGNITVSDPNLPNDTEIVAVDDTRFIVTPTLPQGTGVLSLKPGVQVLRSDATTIPITLTATDSGGLSIAVPFTLAVVKAAPQAPTDIQLSNLTVPEQSLGAPVGQVTVIDPDLPDDTETVTVDDMRFTVVMTSTFQGVLQLIPTAQIIFASEPTVTVVLRATDSTGLAINKTFVLSVIPLPPPGTAGFTQGFSLGFNA